MMKSFARIALALTLVLSAWTAVSQEQPKCRSLDSSGARRFLPDRVPLEAELVAVDSGKFTGLEFGDKSRLVIAPLMTAGLPGAFRQKYEFILVSETRIRLGRWELPSGMVGVALEPENLDAPTRMLIARDFSGNEIERVVLQLATKGNATRLSLVPKGEKEFELRFGSYVIEGKQR
jgi:hypothetical protein